MKVWDQPSGWSGCEQGTKMLNHKKVKNSKLKLASQIIMKVKVGHQNIFHVTD